jgi:hypothetical protein
MKLGDTYTFNDTHFFIPRKGSTALSKHWLIVQMKETTLDREYAGVIPLLLFSGKNHDFCRAEAFLPQT